MQQMSEEFVEGARSVYKSGKRKKRVEDDSSSDDSRFCIEVLLNTKIHHGKSVLKWLSLVYGI